MYPDPLTPNAAIKFNATVGYVGKVIVYSGYLQPLTFIMINGRKVMGDYYIGLSFHPLTPNAAIKINATVGSR